MGGPAAGHYAAGRFEVSSSPISSHPYVGRVREIPREAGIARERFAGTYVRGHRPVILAQALETSAATSKWSLDYLAQRVGHRFAPIEYSLRPVYNPNANVSGGIYHRKTVQLSDGLKLIATQQRQRYWYYISTIPVRDLPELENDLEAPDFLPRDRFRTSAIFVGNDGTGTQFHYDLTTNFLAVFVGCKRVRMLAPSATASLYPLGIDSPLCNFSQLNFDAPDPSRFVKARGLEIWEGDVRAGEMLYIPGLWWHHVTNVGLTIGVTFIWNQTWWQALNWQSIRMQLAHRVMPRLPARVRSAGR